MFYGPVGAYYLVFGDPIKGALILIFGVVVLNIMTEIFFRPFIGSKQMNEHPLIIFLGFLAGPLTLGLKGLILGPLILILSKEFLLNYSELVSDGADAIHSEDTED
jgi:predicted PurR-regulated permease PerM